jgi:hypothetical protein
MPGFYDADAVGKIGFNLFRDWAYNFYGLENQLRADDQLIRAKAGFLLGTARKSVEAAEANYRREFLPPPSREKPRHDPAIVANAQTLERLSKAIGGVMTHVNSQPVPENNRMAQYYRHQAQTLQDLIQSDQMLIGQAELLRTSIEGRNGAELAESASDLQEGVNAIGETLRQRQLLLFPA